MSSDETCSESCSERGEKELNVTRESPSGHTQTLTGPKLAKSRQRAEGAAGEQVTAPPLPVLAAADRLFPASNHAPFVSVLPEQRG